jgi:hypothetical protein
MSHIIGSSSIAQMSDCICGVVVKIDAPLIAITAANIMAQKTVVVVNLLESIIITCR